MYLSPNQLAPFEKLHARALRGIFASEYELGFKILGHAFAKTSFAEEDPAKKEHLLRGFCRAVRVHFKERERKRKSDDLDLERQARYRMRTLPRKRDAVLATLRRECAKDEEYVRRTSIAVKEMDEIAACAGRESELDFSATIEELGELFA